MFEGSKNVPEGAFDRWLEAVGGDNNGSTNNDRTNYWENAPSNALEVPLFLESDRMGFLLDAMTPPDGRRPARRREERAPPGRREPALRQGRGPAAAGALPEGPPVLLAGDRVDGRSLRRELPGRRGLLQDVVRAGQRQPRDRGRRRRPEVRRAVEKWFADVPKSEPVDPIAPRPVVLREEKRLVLEDKVQLPRLYLAWVTPPAFAPGDAALDAVAARPRRAARTRACTSASSTTCRSPRTWPPSRAAPRSRRPSWSSVTARAGHGLEEIRRLVDEEIARLAVRAADASARRRASRTRPRRRSSTAWSAWAGSAARPTSSTPTTSAPGNPDYFEEDLARYRALAPSDVQAAAARFLGPGRVLVSVVPEGKKDLAVPEVAR